MKHYLLASLFLVAIVPMPCWAQDSLKTVSDSVVLKELTVTSRLPVFRQKGGTMVVKVRNSTLSGAGTGRDVLRHIPGIKVTEDGYEVNGKGTPEIYIDNHKVNDVGEVQRLQSKDILKVEVIRQPGAQYGATVSSVVRITTAREVTGNFGFDLASMGSLGRKLSTTQQAGVTYHRKGLRLDGLAYWTLQRGKRIMDPTYRISTADHLRVDSHTSLLDKNNAVYGKGQMNYDFNADHHIGLSYEYGHTPLFSMRDLSSYAATRDGVGGMPTEESYTTKTHDAIHLINAFYQGSAGRLKIDFTSDIVAGNSHTNQNVQDGADRNVTSRAKNFSNLYAAKLIVGHPLWAGTLRLGADYLFVSRRGSFYSRQGILPAADNTIHEAREAVFAEYAASFAKVETTAGLRYEHDKNRYWDGGLLIPGQSKTYDDLLPTVSVDFPVGQTQWSLSYTVKKKRPDFDRLQSNLNYNNRYIYEGGNPLLIPETDHNVEWDVTYRWLMLQVTYQRLRNLIAFDSRTYDKNPDVAIFSLSNFHHAQQLGASVYLSPTLKWWSPVFGIDLTQPFFTAAAHDVSRKMNNPTLNFMLNNTFSAAKHLTFNLDLVANTGGDYGPCHSEAFQTVSAGMRWSVLGDALSLQLQMNDIFVCHQNFSLYSSRLIYTKRTVPDSREAVLTLRYSFHPAKADLKARHAAADDIGRIK